MNHYTAYKARPFTRDERSKTTILFGGLTWKHEQLVKGALNNMGYKAEALPNVKRDDLDVGKELIDTGACCPTTFTTGNLMSFLKSEMKATSKEDTVNKYVFLTAGACGPCRFGQYQESYALALDSLGLKDFRMLFLSQSQLDQGSAEGGGFEINMPLSLGIVWGILIADAITDLEYLTRPYEVHAGETDAVLKDSIAYLYEVFKNRPLQAKTGNKWRVISWHLMTEYFTNALREVFRKWDAIEVDRLQPRPKVKITGEFWLQTHEGEGNYNIKRWLEQEGGEVIAPPIAVWLDYLFQSPMTKMEARKEFIRRAQVKLAAIRLFQRLYRRSYDRFRKALGNLPYELPDQKEIQRLAHPFYHHQLGGGEGYMLVGKALHAYLHRKAHMICVLSPYACMPNTMSIGAMANVLGKYPDLLYAPIEVKGDSEVHALSRCQMILTEAKKRAQRELEEVLNSSGVTIEMIRRYEAAHPEVRRATFRVPHMGYAGTAANYVTLLASKTQRAAA